MEKKNHWKNVGLLWIFLVLMACSGGNEGTLPPSEPVEPEESKGYAWNVADKLGLGWNLGNQLDAHNDGIANETCWGNLAVTQQTFNKLKEAGITSVRIPVTWLGKVGKAPDYAIDKAWLNRVMDVVTYAENAKLNVIINMHHDGADSKYWLNIKQASSSESANDSIKARLGAMWTQIAAKFKHKAEFLIFESMNEIHDGEWGWGHNLNDNGRQYAILNEWNQVFVDAVRAVGGENAQRFLGIPGYCTNADMTLKYLNLPKDVAEGRLMVAVHFYDPYEYTLNAKFSEWGHTGTAGKKENWGDEDHVQSVFAQLCEKYVEQGIPVYIGEMGCVRRDNSRAESFRKYYLEYVCKAAHTYGMAPFYWDNGVTGSGTESSGLFHRATGEYLNNAEEIVGVMKKAVFTDEDSYTLNKVYDEAPR